MLLKAVERGSSSHTTTVVPKSAPTSLWTQQRQHYRTLPEHAGCSVAQVSGDITTTASRAATLHLTALIRVLVPKMPVVTMHVGLVRTVQWQWQEICGRVCTRMVRETVFKKGSSSFLSSSGFQLALDFALCGVARRDNEERQWKTINPVPKRVGWCSSTRHCVVVV